MRLLSNRGLALCAVAVCWASWPLCYGAKADVLGRITVANGVGFVGVGSQLEVFDVDDGSLLQT